MEALLSLGGALWSSVQEREHPLKLVVSWLWAGSCWAPMDLPGDPLILALQTKIFIRIYLQGKLGRLGICLTRLFQAALWLNLSESKRPQWL